MAEPTPHTPALRPVRPSEAGAIRALTLRSKAHWGYGAAGPGWCCRCTGTV